MALRFAKVSSEDIEEAFFYPSDLVNTETTIPLSIGEDRGGYIPRPFASRYISTTIHLPFGGQLYIISSLHICFFASLCSFFSVVKTLFLCLHSTFVARLFSFFLFLAVPHLLAWSLWYGPGQERRLSLLFLVLDLFILPVNKVSYVCTVHTIRQRSQSPTACQDSFWECVHILSEEKWNISFLSSLGFSRIV